MAVRSRTAATASWSRSAPRVRASNARSRSRRAFAAHGGAGQPEEPIEVHIGLHTGHPAQDEGNFYGTDVNLAARIADHVAQAGEIVVSERLRDALGARAACASTKAARWS